MIRGAIGQVYDDVGFFGTLFGSVLTHNLPVLNNENEGSTSSTGQYIATLTTLPAKPPAPTIPANGIIPFSNNYSPAVSRRPHSASKGRPVEPDGAGSSFRIT